MIFRVNKCFNVFLIVILGGCVSFPVSISSDLSGMCLQLSSTEGLYNRRASTNGLYAGNQVIASLDTTYFASELVLDGILDPGTKLEIYNVLRAKNGSAGQFIRIQVRVLNGIFSDVIADIPVHAPYHPREKWTKEFTLDPNAIEFNDNVVVLCD